MGQVLEQQCAPVPNTKNRQMTCRSGVEDCKRLAADAKVSLGVQDLPVPNSLNHQLLCASRDGDLETVQKAIISGAYLETRRPFRMISENLAGSHVDRGPLPGLTPLMYAAKGGYPGCVSLLLDANANVNAEDEGGTRPLHFAAFAGDLDSATKLLAAGADLDALDVDDRTAMDCLAAECVQSPRTLRKWQALCAETRQRWAQATSKFRPHGQPAECDSKPVPSAHPTDDVADPAPQVHPAMDGGCPLRTRRGLDQK